MPERKYALTKIAAGDWLLPSNDAQTIWRIALYQDGPSSGLDPKDFPTDRDFWGIWKWSGEVGPGAYVDTTDWSRWEFWEGMHASRAAAIDAALDRCCEECWYSGRYGRWWQAQADRDRRRERAEFYWECVQEGWGVSTPSTSVTATIATNARQGSPWR